MLGRNKMSLEIKIKIETEKIKAELTQEEARELYEQLKEFFEAGKTVYIPNTNPINPIPWTPPYYINDFPPYDTARYPSHITYSCGSSSKEAK